MKIKKGDNVIILAGSHKGQKGKVMKAIPAEDKVIVEGMNMKKKHKKAARGSGSDKGQMVSIAMPIHVSNVAKQK